MDYTEKFSDYCLKVVGKVKIFFCSHDNSFLNLYLLIFSIMNCKVIGCYFN